MIGRQADHHATEIAHVAAHVAPIGLEVQDGVRDELPWAVEGHVAPAPGLVELDAEARARSLVQEDVLAFGAAPQRDHRRVLQEQDRVGDGPRDALGDQALLERVRLSVGHPPQPVRSDASQVVQLR